MSCTIIAECGINHDGKLDKALRLCIAAKACGADVAKFQTFTPDKTFRYLKDKLEARKLALDQEAFLKIAQHCEDIGIEFCSTPDHVDDLKFLVEDCGVKRIKLGSGSLLYHPLVDAAFDTGLPVLLSTGMATLDELFDVLDRQRQRESRERSVTHLTIMHCVSLYPCPPALANVKAIATLELEMRSMWAHSEFEIGYSDHTLGNYAALAAVALGATVVEKHFTLDNEDEGPDHHMSATPEQFETMVMKISQIEVVLGHGRKEPGDKELAMIPRVRKDADGFQPGCNDGSLANERVCLHRAYVAGHTAGWYRAKGEGNKSAAVSVAAGLLIGDSDNCWRNAVKILGVVTARGGSKRLPNKNLALLGGKPLIAWSIEVGLATCHHVVTSTDDPEIAKVAAELGSEVLMRPEELARDDSPSESVVVHAASQARGGPYSAALLLQPTSPFRDERDVVASLKIMEDTSADSVISVVRFPKDDTLFTLGHANRLRGMADQANAVYTPNGAIYLIRWDYLMGGETWYGNHAYAYVMPPERSLDIDTHADFEAAMAMLDSDGKFVPYTNKKVTSPL